MVHVSDNTTEKSEFQVDALRFRTALLRAYYHSPAAYNRMRLVCDSIGMVKQYGITKLIENILNMEMLRN